MSILNLAGQTRNSIRTVLSRVDTLSAHESCIIQSIHLLLER